MAAGSRRFANLQCQKKNVVTISKLQRRLKQIQHPKQHCANGKEHKEIVTIITRICFAHWKLSIDLSNFGLILFVDRNLICLELVSNLRTN